MRLFQYEIIRFDIFDFFLFIDYIYILKNVVLA